MMRYKLGDFLLRQKESTLIQDGKLYKRAKIRINHNGISVRDEVDGNVIKTKKQFLIHTGQFLLSKIDARNGAFGIVPEELENGIITGNFWTFDVDQKKVLIDYLKAFTETNVFADICIRASSGTTNRKYLDEKKFLNIEIGVPSISEQKSVIKLFHKKKLLFNQFQTKTIEQEKSISKLKQAILQEAVQGKLTVNWRADNSDTVDASVLLKQIQKEKAQLINNKKIKKEKPLLPIAKEEIPYDLPEGWVWCRMEDLNYDLHYGYTASAKSTYAGVGLLRITDIQNNQVNWKTVPDCDIEEKKVSKYLLKENDILIARTGGTIGKSYLINGVKRRAVFASYLIRAIPSKLINANYLKLFLETPHYWKQLTAGSMGTGQPNVNATTLKNLTLQFPPLAEQKAIVEKVNTLMSLCDNLEQEVAVNEKQTNKLMLTTLDKIFQIDTSNQI